MPYIKKIEIEDAKIIFRNFSGKPSAYNRDGKKTFSVVLTPEQARTYEQAGWRIKYLKPREPGDEPTPILNVQVRYHDANSPYSNPHVYTVCGRKKTLLDANTIGTLDYAEFAKIDLVISPYRGTNMQTGEEYVSAYLHMGYFTLENYFGGRYDFDEEDDTNEPW